MGVTQSCSLCRPLLAIRVGSSHKHIPGISDRLDAHAVELAEDKRPYPREGNSLPDFIDVEAHLTRADFELETGFKRNETFQVQLWAPLWVKIVTDLYSILGESSDHLRNQVLLRGLRDPEIRAAIEGAWRLGGSDAAQPIVFGEVGMGNGWRSWPWSTT
jgi:hypothetical protein